MNARMRLLFFTNGLLMRSAGWLVDRCHGWEADAAWRLHVLEQMRNDTASETMHRTDRE